MNKFFSFMSRAFCEDNGSPSFTRIASGFALCFACGWVSAVVKHDHHIPELGGICLFISTLYGLNVVKNFAMKPDPPKE